MPKGNGRVVRMLGCLGRGGFGEVYRAQVERPSGLSTIAAVKVLRADVDPRSQAADRLRDEARLLGLLHHRAIPQVLDVLTLDGRLALLVAYVEGVDLSKALRSTSPPGVRAQVECMATVADALATAWSAALPEGGTAGIVHRDLKPANIRLARDGGARLLDFGIAWTASVARAAETQTSALVGSPAYMAPERFDGASPSPANDVFGLGAVLYEGLARQRLFQDLSLKSMAAISLFDDRYARALHQRLDALDDSVPATVRQLVADLLAFSPHARPTAAEAARRMETLLPSLPGPSLPAWCRDWPWHAPVDKAGPWVGRTLVEVDAGVLVQEAPVHPGPVWAPSDDPPSLEVEPLSGSATPLPSLSTADLRLLVDAPPSPTRRKLVVTIAAVGAVALGALALRAVSAQADVAPAVSQEEPIAHVDLGPPWQPPQVVAASITPALPTPRPTRSPSPPRPTPSAPRDNAGAAARIAAPPPRVDDLLVDASPLPTRTVPSVRTTPPPTKAPPTAPVPPSAAPAASHPWVRPVAGTAVPVRLQGTESTLTLPARVPPGRYTVLAEFDPGLPSTAGVVVVTDHDLTVGCMRGLCRTVAQR